MGKGEEGEEGMEAADVPSVGSSVSGDTVPETGTAANKGVGAR